MAVTKADKVEELSQLERAFKGIWKFDTIAYVGDKEVASAEMMVAPETSKPSPKVQGA